MMKRFRLLTLILPVVPVLAGCHGKEGAGSDSASEVKTAVAETHEQESLREDMAPEDLFLLVEQAVDSWMYFHLLDFSSYKPLIRSTDYDSRQDLYIHHVRYRAANSMGGRETHDKTFEVRLDMTSGRLDDFDVKDVTGSHNPTESQQ